MNITKDHVRDVCIYMEHGMTDMEIHTLMGIPTNTIAGIRDKSIHKTISDKYDYPIVTIREDYTERIHEICTELMENVAEDITQEEIIHFVATTLGISTATARLTLATRPDFNSKLGT